MVESRKRIASTSNNTNMKRAASQLPPRIVPTKASQARDKAITASLASPKPFKRRKTTLAETDPTAKSYHTKASVLKERPSWDLRGKVQDMTNLYKLNMERLDGLAKFRRELEITRDEKDSQEKEALQKAASLRTELTTIERNHVAELSDLHANQRIEYQKLEDNKLNFARRLNTLEMEVSDARNKLMNTSRQLDQETADNAYLKTSIEKTSIAFEEAETETRLIQSKMEKINTSIADRVYEIEIKRAEIKKVDGTVDELKAKLVEAHAVRDRLQGIAKTLEQNATNGNKRAVTRVTL
ncbi:hypothetical protein EDC94DRAFT_654419 [Helicostylum pulchrum]|nr:hypothetical protein EDC94DRAFT_654419 [Helicostylum pulchrum]